MSNPLHDACRHNDLKLVKELLEEHIIDPNEETEDGDTPLEISVDSSRILFENERSGSDTFMYDKSNSELQRINAQIVKALLMDERTKPTISVSRFKIQIGCKPPPDNIVKMFLDKDNRCDQSNLNDMATKLFDYFTLKDTTIAKEILMDPRITLIEKNVEDVINYCLESDKIDIVLLLLECSKINVEPYVEKIFKKACEYDRISIIKFLLNNFDPTKFMASFHTSCISGHVEIVKMFLDEPTLYDQIDFKKVSSSGQTLFYEVCRGGRTDIVKLLLNEPLVDPAKADNDNWTPFYTACCQGHLDVVKLLLEDERVDPNIITSSGNHPFLIACINAHADIVAHLLMNNRMQLGNIVQGGFVCACVYSHHKVVKVLLENANHLCDPNIAGTDGLTLFDYVYKNMNIKAIAMILTYCDHVHITDKLRQLMLQKKDILHGHINGIIEQYEIDKTKIDCKHLFEHIDNVKYDDNSDDDDFGF